MDVITIISILVVIAIVEFVTIIFVARGLLFYKNEANEYHAMYMEEKNQAEFYYGIVERELGNEGG